MTSPRLRSAPMRKITAVVVLVATVTACGGGGGADDDADTIDTRSPTTADRTEWLDQYEPFTKVVEVDGQKVGLMEDEKTLYTYDCDLAERLTAEGGDYGPSERDPVTGDFTFGYGTVCGSH